MIKKISKKQILDVVISMLPVIASILIIVVYLYVPNRIQPPTPFVVLEFTYVWVWFNVAIIIAFFAWNIISIFLKKAQRILIKVAPFSALVLFLFLLYDIAVLKLAIMPQPFFPWIDLILNAVILDASTLASSIASSFGVLFSGYILGSVLGIIFGLFAGLIARVRYWLKPFARFFSSVPVITWVPIIIFMPIGGFFTRAMLLIALAVWVPVFILTTNGVLAIPKSTFESAKTFGIKNFGMLFKVAIPASSVSIFNGLAAGMGVACTALIVAEMMGAASGIGWYIDMQRGMLNYAAMYGAIIILSLSFFAVNALLNIGRKFALKWRGAVE